MTCRDAWYILRGLADAWHLSSDLVEVEKLGQPNPQVSEELDSPIVMWLILVSFVLGWGWPESIRAKVRSGSVIWVKVVHGS